MVQELECVEEEWRYQNPICKRTECSYKYLNKTCLTLNYLDNLDYMYTEDDLCDEECKSFTGCAASILDLRECYFYRAPIIFVSYDLDLNQCIEKCKERSDCVTLSLWSEYGNECFLLNATLAELPDGKDEQRIFVYSSVDSPSVITLQQNSLI
ncbi:hypothetical protein LOTGIDRAFT_175319 [Lottia gigantea]|uniref:Apple domain-containing protein n=1 Tax=Lottia gigantea TaxID=225164 RepID=V4AJK3_LOTGI|nr:hypothetical protein LOTGIDRAFT_175319 [Lottia gigantea]ESO94880.1 hypothetical protein LOTGIDRAFT_175319 [Lottia gigantea]